MLEEKGIAESKISKKVSARTHETPPHHSKKTASARSGAGRHRSALKAIAPKGKFGLKKSAKKAVRARVRTT